MADVPRPRTDPFKPGVFIYECVSCGVDVEMPIEVDFPVVVCSNCVKIPPI